MGRGTGIQFWFLIWVLICIGVYFLIYFYVGPILAVLIAIAIFILMSIILPWRILILRARKKRGEKKIPKKTICPDCGKKNYDNEVYCIKCGSRLPYDFKKSYASSRGN